MFKKKYARCWGSRLRKTRPTATNEIGRATGPAGRYE
jgi:hypothetical protein